MSDPPPDDRFLENLDRVTAIGERAEWDAMWDLVEELFEACRDGPMLWMLASTDPFAESVFCEDGPIPEAVRWAIAKAESFSVPEDVASAIALATRMLAVHPGMSLLDDESVGRKAWLAEVEGVVRDAALAGLSSPHRAVRIASAHALGCVPPLDSRHVAALSVQLRDADEVVRATALLSLGARPEAAALPREEAESTLLSCARVAVKALGGHAVEVEDAAVLASAMDAGDPLPVEWGWRWEDARAPETLAHLALKITYAAKSVTDDAAAKLIAAIAAWIARSPYTEYLQEEVLLRLAFGEPIEAPPLGLTLEESTEAQRTALEALTRAPSSHPAIWKLGLSHLDIRDFLEAKSAMFRPLPVETEGGTRHWHLARLWPAFVFGEISEDVAADAITAGLEPREWLEAACNPHRGNLLMKASDPERGRWTDAEVARDHALVRRVLRDYVSAGFDAGAALTEMRATPTRWDAIIDFVSSEI